jgi:hypothetical protein
MQRTARVALRAKIFRVAPSFGTPTANRLEDSIHFSRLMAIFKGQMAVSSRISPNYFAQ